MATKFKNSLADLVSQAGALRARVKELDAAISTRRTRIGILYAAPVPPADLLAYLGANVDNVASSVVPSLTDEIKRVSAYSFDEWERRKNVASERIRLCTGGRQAPVPVIEEALYYFLADVFKQRIADLVKANVPESVSEVEQITVEQRKAEIDGLNNELRTLLQEREDLVASLKAAGLEFSDPEVKPTYTQDEISLMSFGVLQKWNGQRVYGSAALDVAREVGLYDVMLNGYETSAGVVKGYAALVAMRADDPTSC